MKRRRTKKLNWKLWLLALVIVVAAVLIVLQLTHVTHFFHSNPPTAYQPSAVTGGQNTKGQSGATSLENGNTGISKSSGSSSSGATSKTVTPLSLSAPTGNFVNNHHPNLTGQPATNQMFSVCNTTPGATCQIAFTNIQTGETKSLTQQTVNDGGAVYWSWTLQYLGLTQGTWKIVATASLQGESKSTADAMNLSVGP